MPENTLEVEIIVRSRPTAPFPQKPIGKAGHSIIRIVNYGKVGHTFRQDIASVVATEADRIAKIHAPEERE